jgi:hypothetical protein
MDRIVRGWNFMRWLRLGTGIYALVAAVMQQEWILGFAGVFLSGMALLNIGCCAGGTCTPIPRRNITEKDTGGTIQFEEIKSEK